jgi:hypothetical protein
VSAPSGVQFYRGPYDGLVLDVEGVRAFCHTVTSRRGNATRYFLLMPPLREWERIVAGRPRPDRLTGSLHPYEMVTRGGRAEIHYLAFGEFAEAMGDG